MDVWQLTETTSRRRSTHPSRTPPCMAQKPQRSSPIMASMSPGPRAQASGRCLCLHHLFSVTCLQLKCAGCYISPRKHPLFLPADLQSPRRRDRKRRRHPEREKRSHLSAMMAMSFSTPPTTCAPAAPAREAAGIIITIYQNTEKERITAGDETVSTERTVTTRTAWRLGWGSILSVWRATVRRPSPSQSGRIDHECVWYKMQCISHVLSGGLISPAFFLYQVQDHQIKNLCSLCRVRQEWLSRNPGRNLQGSAQLLMLSGCQIGGLGCNDCSDLRCRYETEIFWMETVVIWPQSLEISINSCVLFTNRRVYLFSCIIKIKWYNKMNNDPWPFIFLHWCFKERLYSWFTHWCRYLDITRRREDVRDSEFIFRKPAQRPHATPARKVWTEVECIFQEASSVGGPTGVCLPLSDSPSCRRSARIIFESM